MSETIEVTVRVPADLEVVKSHSGYKLFGPGGYGLWYADNSESWTCALGQQIAAAVEARKPKPPKFQVGDVVEWQWPSAENGLESFAGVVCRVGECPFGFLYWIRGMVNQVKEADLKLVRRAEK